MERMKPFEWKSIEEIWMMVFGNSCKLNEGKKERILEMFNIDQDITKRQIIMENNINQARYFAEQLIRMRNIITMMSIIK